MDYRSLKLEPEAWNRTDNLLITKQVLYHLSYTGIKLWRTGKELNLLHLSVASG